MAIYLLTLLGAVLLAALLGAMMLGAFRLLRRWLTVARAEFTVTPRNARPGEEIQATAHVVSRGDRKLVVHATLTCTMFDHRARDLFAQTVPMTEVDGQPGRYAVKLHLPDCALRTGTIGDDLSDLFSEDARRLLVFWSVRFDVSPSERPGTVFARHVVAVHVPEGKPLQTDQAYMNQLVVETFAALKDDMILNWLVKMAARDDVITDSERTFLHDLLATSHGIRDAAAADARIDDELNRQIEIDPVLLRKHISADARLSFYRLLYAVAWRDGSLDKREHKFLIDSLQTFGLDRSEVAEVEREVLRGMAASSLQ